MSTFTLAISCLTTSNLPWFVDLTFQVSLQHWTLLPFTTGYCFCFGSISSFFLELFIHWSPVAYWAHTILGSSSFSILSFCLFILFMGLSRQEYWSGLPFPSPDSIHGHHQMVNIEIRLILFFAAKDGEARYSQQKQELQLTVVHIMSFLLQNSGLNWRK